MRDHARSLVHRMDPVAGRNLLREYLQARILEGLQRAGAMSTIAFQGGTALRFLYGLPRYSEDLDFALEGSREHYDLREWMEAIARQLRREGYQVTASLRERGNVHAGWLRFPGILHYCDLSPHRDQVLGVRIDVDTNPPAGAVTDTRLVRRHVSLRLHHHDRASLLAGKLHAVLWRPWAKGRDIHDLVWYLSDPTWPLPNLALLNSARRQSDPCAVPLGSVTWRKVVADRVAELPWDAVTEDVRPFLESGKGMVGKDEVLELLEPDR